MLIVRDLNTILVFRLGCIVFAIWSMVDGVKSIMLRVVPAEFVPMVNIGVGVGVLLLLLWKKKVSFTKELAPFVMKKESELCESDSTEIDVFVSYCVRDRFDSMGRTIPGNVIDRMIAEFDKEGITYWIDKKGLFGGTTFPAEIAKQIKNAKCMVFVSSANSNASTWTMNEIATANTYGKPIIPFRIDHSAYNPAIMIYLAAVHYILYPGNPNALRQVVEAVKKVG